MRLTFRPLTGGWRYPETPRHRRRDRPYRSDWRTTVADLTRELEALNAKNPVLQLDVREQDIRVDGTGLLSGREAAHPGVVLSAATRAGALTIPCDSCTRWRDNVRSVALGLEALRAVDRYGISPRGEQYTGWRQLPPGATPAATPMPAAMTAEDAARFMLAAIGNPATPTPNAVITVPSTRAEVYRAAARKLHPDTGGDTEMFQRLQQAMRLLEGDG